MCVFACVFIVLCAFVFACVKFDGKNFVVKLVVHVPHPWMNTKRAGKGAERADAGGMMDCAPMKTDGTVLYREIDVKKKAESMN